MTLEEIKANIKWWESKRWIYNLAVGLFGVYGIYDGLTKFQYSWTLDDSLGIILWVIGANILYSLGILLEIFDWYYLKNKAGVKSFRKLFFTIGLLFSCIWTLSCCSIYFSKALL